MIEKIKSNNVVRSLQKLKSEDKTIFEPMLFKKYDYLI